MKRYRKGALAVFVTLVVVAAAYATFTRLVPAESAARTDSYRVWIALLKGFEGDVYYVGNDQSNAYFRIGRFFWSYFKVPACAARPPEVFSVGAGNPYVVRLHLGPDNTIHGNRACPGEQGYELGDLDRGPTQ
jgi:hypothetical protein